MRVRRRGHTPARIAAAAGLAALIACGAACRSGESTAAAPSSAAVGTRIGAKVAPPSAIVGAVTSPLPADAASADAAQPLAAVRAQLETALAGASRCTADGDCRNVATGAKACGGPTGYRAYSALGGDAATIDALAERERALSLAEARASGRVSTCSMVADPGAHCHANRCATGPATPR
ncbi:MAG: hypothetical protein ABW032_02080 [Burkholderiaceae bacterium]